jgi:glutamyl endopeptidase
MGTELEWLSQVLPSEQELAAILDDDPVTALVEVARQRAPVETGFEGDPGKDPELVALFAKAQEAAAKVKKNADPSLTKEEVQALGSFVHLVARPALRIRDGQLAGVPQSWERLATEAPIVDRRIRGVGRLDTPGGEHTGTGWFVAKGLVLTNKHVVAQLCGLDIHFDRDWREKVGGLVPKRNDLWGREPTKRPVWDPGDAPGDPAKAPGRITKIRAIHADLDMGLLEVEGVADDGDLALPLSAAGPKSAEQHPVYIAGYPAVDEDVMHKALVKLLFPDAESSGLKRVSPGKLVALVDPPPIAFNKPRESHDASTLGGSSGSPVVDLESHRAVALHYSGKHGQANYAVPLWLIKDDPFFTDNQLKFG